MVVGKDHFDLDYFGGPGFQVTANPWPMTRSGTVQRAELAPTPPTAAWSPCSLTGRRRPARWLRASGADVDAGHPRLCTCGTAAEDPYLYTAVATLQLVETARRWTRCSCRFGVRELPRRSQGAASGSTAASYPLHGVSRHQDRRGIGNALTKEMHKEDMDLIREIGANTIRLAHYQHAQYFYDLCDEYGMIVWAEIPYISEHMPNGRENTISQMKELITQNYNHPSIVCWGVSNEITISTKDKADMLDNHRVLNDLCHELDPTRPTTLACYAMCGPFNQVGPPDRPGQLEPVPGLVRAGVVPERSVDGLLPPCATPTAALGYSASTAAEAMPNLHSLQARAAATTPRITRPSTTSSCCSCFERHPWLWSAARVEYVRLCRRRPRPGRRAGHEPQGPGDV